MKIRNGFVSNSSSSSFVIIGREVTKEQITAFKEKLLGRPKTDEDDSWHDNACDAMYDARWLYDSERESPVLGKILCTWSDEDCDRSYTIQQLQDTINEAKNMLGEDVKIFIGTKYG